MKVLKDRRKSPRALLDSAVVIEVAGERFLGRVLNIGTQGISVLCKLEEAPQGEVRLRFNMAKGSKPICSQAQVVRKRWFGKLGVWGLRFLNLDPETAEAIRLYVDTARAA